jgi:dTDP-glucose 4,6-dehydratase
MRRVGSHRRRRGCRPDVGDERRFERLLVTGGAGFIGSCYVRDVLGRRDGTRITVLDKLTYAGNEANLATVRADREMDGRLTFVRGDIADPAVVRSLVEDADAVVNFAAESHVDRSILDPEAFLATGVIGVHVLLEACRAAAGHPRYLQVSTDEVYGSVAEGHVREDAPLAPRSPYAAAKAAGELLVRSYVITHGIDALVTRGANTYGPYHHPEKLIPLFITNAIDDLPLPLYGDGLQRRDWLFVSDHAAAIDHVLRHGLAGETYNVVGGQERSNREVVALLLEQLGKPWSLVREVEDRPGHDRRYAMDGSKLAGLGWHAATSFEDGLAATVDWFRANEAWWRATRSGEWDGWYDRQYGRRLATSQPAAATAAGPDVDPPGSGPGTHGA